MLTLANTNTTQAKTYYKKENYYSQEDAEVNSQWQGQGASINGLSGAITDLEAYENIVNGLSPDGKTQLRQKQNHEGKFERAGIDLTFSAPKSVSIACLVGGDTRLEEAHRNAVSRTIDLIESRYATTRINKQPVQTDNLIVAKWHHDTSRELDPHLHTHCLVMNCTLGPDGKWRSISNKPFFQNKILLGQIYRNELASECRKLGYEIEPHPKELFEIKGYTREQIEGFSKRHEQIKNKLEEIGAEPTTENKIWAWRKTRVKKNHEIGRDEKLPYWHEEAHLYGIIHPDKAQAVEPTLKEQDEQIAAGIKLAVDVAIEHCSERQVAFTGEDIEKFVIAEVKPFSIHQLEDAIAAHPELIKTYDGQRRYTTQAALARELATIKLMQQGKGLCSAIATSETIDSYLADKSLTSGQREAIALTATSTDQFIAWQGVAGAGKTYVLNELKQLIQMLQEVTESGEITLLAGYAPSKEATKVLGKEVGIETNTVASLLLSKQPAETKPNQIWIVDEAGMLSAKDGYALLQRATAIGARVILVGDTRQLSAVEAGNPFKSLQQAGISTAHLNQSLRQKVPDLQQAASLAAAGNHADAVQHLLDVGRVQEISDLEQRSTLIAQDYLQLSPEQRRTTLVLAGTHKEKAQIMQELREGLKQEGTLVGEDAVVTRLKQKDLTNVQARYQHHYNIGDVVIPLREYKRAGLHKDRAYAVSGYEADKLILSDWSGNQVAVDPMKFRKTVYTQQNIEVCVGDGLRWTREDKQSGRGNRDEFTVTAIEGRTATIRYHNGKEESLYLDEPLALDYAIASTTYSSQGKTADRVLVSSTCDATVSSESVYVAISRAKYDLKIYAENVDFLLEQAQESKAQKTVLELLQPTSKVQVAATAVRAGASSVEQAADVSITPKLSHEDSAPVTNIERPLKRQNQQVAKSTPSPTLKPQSPKQLEVFWHPISATEAPPHIETKHWHELVEGSAIHPAIASGNFRSLQMGSIEQEHEAWEYLMYSHKLERTNIGQLTTEMLKRYAHIEAGGWWCNSGANALSFSNLEAGKEPQEKIWGCYKPNEPRSNPDKPGKVIKYEHPPKTDLGIFLLDVPEYIAQKIYQKAGVDPSQEDRDRGFWYCAWKYNLPITLAEGAKKAASLLSQGHVAIGLPGIYAGYRSKDEQGRPIKAHLHEELAVFATLGRDISFCFDYETRPETKRNIEIAISRTGSLLQQQGAKVNVVSLPGPEKGVDDLIVAHSPLAYEKAASVALPLRQWREHNKQSRHLAIVPPKKLSVQERKEQLKEPPLGQHPINNPNLNQLQEPDHDSQQRQINREYSSDGHLRIDQSLSPIDQKDRPVGENQQSNYEQQQSIERTNPAPGNYPDREPERIESQSSELLAAISRHLELQTVEQIAADITELDRSVADSLLSTEGTEQASRIIAHPLEIPQQVEQSKTTEHLAQLGERNDGRHTGIECDRQLDTKHRGVESSEHRSFAGERQIDTEYGKVASSEHQLDSQHRGVESPEQRSFAGEQRTQELHPQAIERYSLDSQADAGRLHHPVQSSPGGTEVGQTERDNPRVSDINEQSVAQAGGHQPDSSPSQRAGDGNLRGNYQPTETIAQQRQELSASGREGWAQALGDLAQVVQSVGVQQLLGDAELEPQLTKITLGLQTLNLQQREPYEFTGLSELAQAFKRQQLKSDIVESLELLGQQKLVVDAEIAQVRSSASSKTCELQLKIENLALAVSSWQPQVEIAQAISQVSGIAHQLEQRHTFDFGDLPQLLNGATNEQLLSQSGLDTKLALLAKRIAALTTKAPTQFEGMSALAENLQALQAQSQLTETDLTKKLNEIAFLVDNSNPQVVRYEFEGNVALSELAQTLRCLNTRQQLLQGELLEQLQHTTARAISAISQHIEQSKEDLSMLQTVERLASFKQALSVTAANKKEAITELTQQLRNLPLNKVAIRLGLTQDKYDKHKWRCEGQTISINDQKFYDHHAKQGGYGAIDLVIHVQSSNFKEALQWLADSSLELPPVPRQSSPHPKAQEERQPFQPPSTDESKWLAVRQYLVEKRQLPVALVDELHSQGKIYADAKQNAVFLRQDIEGNLTGASLRGTYKDSSFKGLATGSQRENGWFSFVQGEGELKRIVLVESAIDALSAAALAEQPGKAMFISTDGAGVIPVPWLQQQGVVVVAAHDGDRAGEEMAWRLAMEISSVTRATPAYGKDWNEQLQGRASELDVSQWRLVALALGKPDTYVVKIMKVINSEQALSSEAQAAMQQDFSVYKQLSSNLWQWYQIAQASGYPQAYLKRIASVAIALHHSQKPIPLSIEALSAMQQDVNNYNRANRNHHHL